MVTEKAKLNSYWAILFAVVLAVVILFPGSEAWAQGSPFQALQTKTSDAFRQSRNLIYVVGGIAALGLGVLAFFGKFRWIWFFSLVAGIACVAIIDQIFNYATIQGTGAGTGLSGG
ncbi:MAG: hypothetical protein AB7G80_06385 [Dongiaceae bacterium]